MCIFHTEKYKDFIIEILQDEDPVNPREWDNLGTMVCWHKRYDLGDGLPEKMRHRFHSLESRYGSTDLDLFTKWKKLHQNQLVVLPLYLCDHSRITISTKPFHCSWNSGQFGWIYTTHEQIKNKYNVEELTPDILEEVNQVLISEVKIYGEYLRDDVWGYIVKNQDGQYLHSCWGFYGDLKKYCLEEAQHFADWVYQILNRHDENSHLC
jgi:hypothetical protein